MSGEKTIGHIEIWRTETGGMNVLGPNGKTHVANSDLDLVMNVVRSQLPALAMTLSMGEGAAKPDTNKIILDLQRGIAERDAVIAELRSKRGG